MALEFDYDLLMLDLNLPGVDGWSVLRSVRQGKANLPMIILTARNRIEDRVQCLDTGADDYLVKPFPFLDLSARARALLRRSHLPSESVLKVHDLSLDRVERGYSAAAARLSSPPRNLRYLNTSCGMRAGARRGP